MKIIFEFLTTDFTITTVVTTKIFCFSENFNEDFVLILTKDISIVRVINSPHKI